jgi:hypothetical protein
MVVCGIPRFSTIVLRLSRSLPGLIILMTGSTEGRETEVGSNRLEQLQGSLGIPLPAATQWEIVRDSAAGMEPVFEALIQLAAHLSLRLLLSHFHVIFLCSSKEHQ